ncbi:MAG: hypothetical protein K2Q18_15190 [Bdellovibrionales bacterium]|nr:hypothetical protein [Bdellovibrionales bacterium]
MHKKRRFNFYLIVLFLGLLFIEGPLFSEEPNKVQNANPSAETAPQEDHNSEDLEELLKKYNKDSEKILDSASKLHNIQESETQSEVNESDLEGLKVPTAAEEAIALKRANGKKKERVEPLPSNLSASLKMALEPLQKLSETELLKRLDDGLKDSQLRPYFEEIPDLKLLAVRLIKDKESLPSLVKILENKDRLIHFVSALLFSIVFGFVLKRAMHREGRVFVVSALFFILRFFIMLAIRLAIINYFFSDEIAPALKVFKQTFMTH